MIVDEHIQTNEAENNSKKLNDPDENDPVVNEIDVYLSRSLSNNVYVLQYPTKTKSRNFDDSTYLGARIKPKQSKLEIEIDLNTTNSHYSKVKGEQFALNVDGKQTYSVPSIKQNSKDEKYSKYFRSNLMDKVLYTSTNATLGEMNRLYHLGYLNGNKLSLTSIKSILQMKPSFEYFDIYEKKVKDLKESGQAGDTDYSTEEEPENEVDKAELVTLKYSSNQFTAATQEPEQNWIPLKFKNLNEPNSTRLKGLLNCTNTNNKLKLDYSEEEAIKRLVDFNTTNPEQIQVTVKTDKTDE